MSFCCRQPYREAEEFVHLLMDERLVLVTVWDVHNNGVLPCYAAHLATLVSLLLIQEKTPAFLWALMWLAGTEKK